LDSATTSRGVMILLLTSLLALSSSISLSKAEQGELHVVAKNASISVSILIDYGNGTIDWHDPLVLPDSSTVFNATLAVATVNYSHYPQGVFVDAINDVWNTSPYYWTWWYWNFTESTWSLGPIASDRHFLTHLDIIAWHYVNTETWLPLPHPPLPKAIVVDIDPDSLNLKSNGKWITAYIELPEGYNVSDIDRATILLNDTIPVDQFWVDKPLESVIGDYDEDGIPDLMVKFNKQDLIAILSSGEAIITITGDVNGISFEGSDTIRVIGE